MRILAIVSIPFFLGCNGSTPRADTASQAATPVRHTLAEPAYADACAAAREALSCGGTMSAEGERFESCDCTATGDGKTGRLEVRGEDEGGAKVDANFELVWGDAGWVLGKRLQ
jgi:hypothetical protein